MNGRTKLFSYRSNISDKQEKFSLDLKSAKIKKGMRNESQPYIFIENLSETPSVVVRVSFETQEQFDQWLRIVMQAKKSEEELQIQYKLH